MNIDSYYNMLYRRYQAEVDEADDTENNMIRVVQETVENLNIDERADKFFSNISEENALLLMTLIERLKGASLSEMPPIVHKLVDLSEEVIYNAVYEENK